MKRLNIYELNEKVWKSGATEILKFKYLGNTYHLIQSETPAKSEGNTYVYRENIRGEEYEPVLHINWQFSNVNAYVKPSQFASGPDSEGMAVLHYLLSVNKDEYRKLIDSYLLVLNISDGRDFKESDWLNYEYYGTGSDTFQF